jgi:hypothetical protein
MNLAIKKHKKLQSQQNLFELFVPFVASLLDFQKLWQRFSGAADRTCQG